MGFRVVGLGSDSELQGLCVLPRPAGGSKKVDPLIWDPNY